TTPTTAPGSKATICSACPGAAARASPASSHARSAAVSNPGRSIDARGPRCGASASLALPSEPCLQSARQALGPQGEARHGVTISGQPASRRQAEASREQPKEDQPLLLAFAILESGDRSAIGRLARAIRQREGSEEGRRGKLPSRRRWDPEDGQRRV